ncbi:hypothetical protein ACFXD5_06750 [Streptomyces sp. NPDC059385]|uniref:hypothetical protein n=1 Tax=Streptomyces sp. NPDC059385 TaxID=3346817 RepID=UPI0036A78C85
MTEQPNRHTVDTITSDALDALYEMLAATQQTELARQLANADKAFLAAHLRAARLGSAVARARRALASTILQARRQAARAEQAEAAIARVRALASELDAAEAYGGLADGYELAAYRIRAALDDPQEPRPPAVHIGNRANAEDCPACSGTNLPYPFICPSPDQP